MGDEPSLIIHTKYGAKRANLLVVGDELAQGFLGEERATSDSKAGQRLAALMRMEGLNIEARTNAEVKALYPDERFKGASGDLGTVAQV